MYKPFAKVKTDKMLKSSTYDEINDAFRAVYLDGSLADAYGADDDADLALFVSNLLRAGWIEQGDGEWIFNEEVC